MCVKKSVPESVDGHTDPGRGQNAQVDLELGQVLEEIQGLAGVLLLGCDLLQLLPDLQDVIFHTHADNNLGIEEERKVVCYRRCWVAGRGGGAKSSAGKRRRKEIYILKF